MTVYLFCYDISDSKRVKKVAKQLEKYGLRLQKSFFQIKASKEDKNKIKKELLSLLDLRYDRLNIYPICEDCFGQIEIQGQGSLLRTEDFTIV